MGKRRLRAASVEELARGGALAKRQKVTPEAASDQKRNIKRTIPLHILPRPVAPIHTARSQPPQLMLNKGIV